MKCKKCGKRTKANIKYCKDCNKKRKLLTGIFIAVIIIAIIIASLVINNKIKSKYMTKGDYYIYFFNEHGGFDFDEEELEEKIQNDTGEFTKEVANEMYVNWYIEKEQMEDLDEPVTREIVAQTLVRAMEFRTEHDIKIKDIDKCVDKQAIIDAVGMKFFELSNNKFKPNGYMTKEEVEEAYEKMLEIEMNSHYEEGELEIPFKDDAIILDEDTEIIEFGTVEE